jgi:hypothetical protein
MRVVRGRDHRLSQAAVVAVLEELEATDQPPNLGRAALVLLPALQDQVLLGRQAAVVDQQLKALRLAVVDQVMSAITMEVPQPAKPQTQILVLAVAVQITPEQVDRAALVLW